MQNTFHVLYIIFCFTFFSSVSFSMGKYQQEFTVDDKTITIHLSDRDWQHILIGRQTDQGYSGGHDYQHYYENVIKNENSATKVFFDLNMMAYIVSSSKGDSLPVIIKNLEQKKPVHYHTLFPPNVLTQQFVLRAFESAYREGRLNHEKSIFYTKIDDFFVAGFFTEHNDNSYSVNSIFPDLSWYYRIDFRHHANELFTISRFLEWDGRGWWLQQGDIKTETDVEQKTNFIPEPIFKLHRLKSESTLLPREFVISYLLKDDINRAFVDSNRVVSVVDFFFADPNAPTEEEFTTVKNLLNYMVPNLRFTINKNLKLQTKLKISRLTNNLENLLKCSQQEINIFRLNKEGFYKPEFTEKICVEIVGNKLVSNGLHLGEEILHQMLLFSIFEDLFEAIPKNMLSAANKKTCQEAAKQFAKNFQNVIVTDSGRRQELVQNKLMFNVRQLGSEYALELMSSRDIFSNAEKQDLPDQVALAYIKGEPSQFAIKFLKLTDERFIKK